MGTRSDIIVQRADGKWARIYCHWDGYISHNGVLLQKHYNSQELAEALVAPGDLASLKETVGKKHPFERPSSIDEKAYKAFQKKYGRMNTYYGRDRGEPDVEARIGFTLQAVWPSEDTWTEFTYVRQNGQWYVSDPDAQTLILLSDAIAADKRGENAVKSLVKTPFGAIAKRV